MLDQIRARVAKTLLPVVLGKQKNMPGSHWVERTKRPAYKARARLARLIATQIHPRPEDLVELIMNTGGESFQRAWIIEEILPMTKEVGEACCASDIEPYLFQKEFAYIFRGMLEETGDTDLFAHLQDVLLDRAIARLHNKPIWLAPVVDNLANGKVPLPVDRVKEILDLRSSMGELRAVDDPALTMIPGVPRDVGQDIIRPLMDLLVNAEGPYHILTSVSVRRMLRGAARLENLTAEQGGMLAEKVGEFVEKEESLGG